MRPCLESRACHPLLQIITTGVAGVALLSTILALHHMVRGTVRDVSQTRSRSRAIEDHNTANEDRNALYVSTLSTIFVIQMTALIFLGFLEEFMHAPHEFSFVRDTPVLMLLACLWLVLVSSIWYAFREWMYFTECQWLVGRIGRVRKGRGKLVKQLRKQSKSVRTVKD